MLDTLASLGEFLGGLAVIGGVGYAVIQVRQFRAAKEREISLELLHSFQTPDFVKALLAVYEMPDGLDSKDKIVAHLGEKLPLVYAMMTTGRAWVCLFFAASSVWIWWTISSAAPSLSRGESWNPTFEMSERSRTARR